VAFLGATSEHKRAAALQKDLRDALQPVERVLWSGFPRQGLLFRPADIFLIPFSLLWGGFAIFWEIGVIFGEPDTPDRFDPWDKFFVLWGIPFVLIGLYLIFGRFIEDMARRARTIYAVTDRRAILLTNFLGHNVRSLHLQGLSDINLSKKPDGLGTIVFGPANISSEWARGWPGARGNISPAFEGIARAQDVLKIIRDAQAASHS
jgi:hypothetical protein